MAERSRKPDKPSETASTSRRQSRRRAPKAVILRLHADLEPNENHPLYSLTPERREESRQQLFAAILARLASGAVNNEANHSIMEEPDSADRRDNLSKE